MSVTQALWLDEGTDPDYGKLAGRFNKLSRSARDPRTTLAAFVADRKAGLDAEIYWAASWDADLDGKQAAELMNTRWLALKGNVSRLDVQFDVEQHDPGYVVALMKRWRELRPFCVTSWTFESFQAPIFGPIRAQILAANETLVPQAYDGGMGPFDALGAVRELVDWGFPFARIAAFHDAATLYRGWYGWAFSSGRLP